MKKSVLVTIVIFLLVFTTGDLAAQCSMCKTTAESDLNSGGSIATGLNTGILYLMAIPYVILMTGAYFFFRKPIDAKLRIWKEKFIPSRSQG